MTETVEGLEYLLKSRVYKLDIDDKMPSNLLEVRNNYLNDIFSVTVEADVDTIHITYAFNNFGKRYSECLEVEYSIHDGKVCAISNYRDAIV